MNKITRNIIIRSIEVAVQHNCIVQFHLVAFITPFLWTAFKERIGCFASIAILSPGRVRIYARLPKRRRRLGSETPSSRRQMPARGSIVVPPVHSKIENRRKRSVLISVVVLDYSTPVNSVNNLNEYFASAMVCNTKNLYGIFISLQQEFTYHDSVRSPNRILQVAFRNMQLIK